VSTLTPSVYSEIVGGTRTYVAALQRALSRTHLCRSTAVSSIRRAGDGYAVADTRGDTREFDHLVLATGAHQACQILESVPDAAEQRRQLARIKYSPTTIAIHGDRRAMPPKARDWSVFNIRWDGRVSLSTVWKGHGGDQPVFRSWVEGRSSGLAPVYHFATYDHPVVDVEYFQAQQKLGELMGRCNLWFAGLYTYDIDIHESAIQSAIRIARQLAPGSAALRRLV
jgi:predicted NAD/FAD-binding protein